MRIWNTIDILTNDIKVEFLNGATLGDLAKKYHCVPITIKRKLRSVGVDTSIHNHSNLAKSKHREKVCDKTKILTRDWLIRNYINENKDTKTIAEELGIHYSSVRKKIQEFELRKTNDQLVGAWQSRYKSRHGYLHPSQHLNFYARSLNKVEYQSISNNHYRFKSMMELTIALYLDKTGVKWSYESVRIPYVHHISGKSSYYLIDFETEKEWLEVKPNESMIPSDKRLYAEAAAKKVGKSFRGILDQERADGWQLLLEGYRSDFYEFIHINPSESCKQISYYFKNVTELKLKEFQYPVGFKYHYRACIAPTVHKLVLRRIGC